MGYMNAEVELPQASHSSIFYLPQENPGYTSFIKLLRITLVKVLSSSSKGMVGPILYRLRILVRDPEVENKSPDFNDSVGPPRSRHPIPSLQGK